MKILTSDKTGNRPVVTSCNRLIDYVENSEYTLNCWSSYAIDIAVILVLSVYWHKNSSIESEKAQLLRIT